MGVGSGIQGGQTMTAHTCGTCAKFQECWIESSQVMKSIGCEPVDDYEASKSIPACPDYQESKHV